jgi:hypothetical protein
MVNIMSKRVYLKAREAEMEMQLVREEEGFTGKNEKLLISNMVKNAKLNSRIGDKLLMVVDPKQIHIPDWQRRINLSRAYAIGNNYNPYKWDEPKVLLYNGKLICIDGQHRIYGAFKAEREGIVVEIMECSIEEAIDLFLSQSVDRARMRPMDIYHAALAGGKEDYIKLRDICHKHNVAVSGDDEIENTVGTLTSIYDGIEIVQRNPDLLEDILNLLGKLQWNGYADSYNGKAYTAKIIRVLKKLYAYCMGREDQMEEALLTRCMGTEFFVENVMDKTQAQIFDYLSEIVRYEANNPFKDKEKTKKTARKKATAN